jgi:hypothetical protein
VQWKDALLTIAVTDPRGTREALVETRRPTPINLMIVP